MFRSSFSVGRYLGVEVRLHVSFPLLLALAVATSVAIDGNPFRGFGLWLAFVFAVVVRELARALVATYSGLRLRAIFLLPVGGVMAMAPREGVMGASPNALILTGTLANLFMGALLMALCYAIDPHVPLFAQPWISTGHVLRSFVWMEFLMAAVNILPTATLPTAQMLRYRVSQIAKVKKDKNAQSPSQAIAQPEPAAPPAASASFGPGILLSIALIVAGLLLHNLWPVNLWLILLGGFLLLTAHIKAGQTLSETDADAILVNEVMLTEYTMLSSSDTLEGALSQTVHSLQDVFPVVRGDRLVGSVSRQTIAEHLQVEGDGYLQGVMSKTLQLAAPEEKVALALRRAASLGASEFIPVVEGGSLLGILTPQSLARAAQQIKLIRARREPTRENNRD